MSIKSNKGSILEVFVLIASIIGGCLAIASAVNNYMYKKRLRAKATAYLREELGEIEQVKGPVAVYTEETEQRDMQTKGLLIFTAIACVLLFVIRKIRR